MTDSGAGEAWIALGALPEIYGVSRMTVHRWLKRDGIAAIDLSVDHWRRSGRPNMAVKMDDIRHWLPADSQ